MDLVQGPDASVDASRRLRDLRWALALPSLVVPSAPADVRRSPSAGEAVRVATDPAHWMPARFFSMLSDSLDTLPSAEQTALAARIPDVGRRRHGIVYEDMLALVFEKCEGVRLLARDIVVADRGRTLGQADFLLEWEGQIHHLEVAIKFYLRRGAPGDIGSYTGIHPRDRLDHKLAHMLYHQRRILDGTVANDELRRRGLPLPDRRVVSLRGVVYSPLEEAGTAVPPRWWGSVSQWSRLPQFSTLLWTAVSRAEQFAPLSGGGQRWEPAGDLDPAGRLSSTDGPLLVAGSVPGGGEITRGYVVRNGA